jgi:hypothetical protein
VNYTIQEIQVKIWGLPKDYFTQQPLSEFEYLGEFEIISENSQGVKQGPSRICFKIKNYR